MKAYFILLMAAFIGFGANAQSSKDSKEQTQLTADKLVKQWHLRPNESTNRYPAGIGEGTFIHLKNNGEYEAYIVAPELVSGFLLGPTTEVGTWKFNKKKETLTITSGKQVVVWDIQSLSDTGLVLVNQTKKSVWTFTDKK